MDCSYVVAFSNQNDWTPKRHYKVLNVTVNQCLSAKVHIFEEFDCKDKTFVDSLVLVESYQEQFKQFTLLSG